jgi:MscS family membrane protein
VDQSETESVKGAAQAVTEMLDLSLFAENSVTSIGLFVVAVFATLAVGKLLKVLFKRYLTRWAEGSQTKLDDILILAFERPLYYICLAIGLQFSFHLLVLPDFIHRGITNATTVVVIVFVAWTMNQLIGAFKTVYVDAWTEASESKLDDQIVPILENTLKGSVWAFAFLMVFSNMGYDLMSVITGLGIGGLALAMAAKDTLSNVFGSVTIFADRPFQVDDMVRLAGFTGIVEEVGLRVCRLRTLDGTLVTVPNAVMVGGVVENLSERTAHKQVLTIGLVYETSSEELAAAIACLKGVFEDVERVQKGTVRFSNFGDSALEITGTYWLLPLHEWRDVVHEVNVLVKARFDEAGHDMAFPSTTVYMASSTDS